MVVLNWSLLRMAMSQYRSGASPKPAALRPAGTVNCALPLAVFQIRSRAELPQ